MRMSVLKCLWLSTVPLVTACAAIHRPATTIDQLERDAAVARTAERATRDSVIERLVRRAQARGDKTLDLLLLSGGGQNGAFGVGFLRGWRTRPDAPMPRFDLVSGISTGALQAPYALLGTAAAIDSVTATYARAATEIAPTLDWWFLFRRTGGVVNTTRFDRTLEKSINGTFAEQLRGAFREDRQLIFGTADFDLGIGRTWSLGETLDSSAAGLTRTRMLLKAATAIPGIFPPVVIDGHVHADGGVIANVLVPLTFDDYRRLAERLRAKGIGEVTVRLWVVMNIWSHTDIKIITPSSRGAISARSTAMLFYSHQPETLSGLADLARAVSSQVPGVRVELKVATLPLATQYEPGADQLFDRGFMKRIDEIGFAKSQSASPWDAIPSAYLRPPREP